MRSTARLLSVVGFLITGMCVAADASKADRAALQGTWIAVSGEVGGQQVTDDALKVFKIVVKDDRMTFTGNESTFTLDVSKTPKIIAVTPLAGPRKGKVRRAIYSIKKDVFVLCMRGEPAEDAQPPKEFATQPGDGLVLVTLKRDAAAPEGK